MSEKEEVVDSLEDSTVTPLVSYSITSYGADMDVDGYVKRITKGTIRIPPFQRDYVWKMPEASRFIESLLLGLPVPGVFLAKEDEGENLLVLDGQQRLKSLEFFLGGFFNPKKDEKKKKVFRLEGVQKQFEGKTFEELDTSDKTRLTDSIIHATIVKQNSPEDGSTSIYHIFERLNSEGRKLTDQEIRCAVYHGPFIELIEKMNEDSSWRSLYGKESPRQKDKELIIRWLALLHYLKDYKSPMSEFITKFTVKHRKIAPKLAREFLDTFSRSCQFVEQAVGKNAFRPERSFNAAVFDSVMWVVAKKELYSKGYSKAKFKEQHAKLLGNKDYLELVSRSTADGARVVNRITLASTVLGPKE